MEDPKKPGHTWYPMCPTLHKILYHGGEIIRLLPPSILIGFLSEEPSESSNKDVKKFLLEHSRQKSLETRNIDTFHRMMERSDPIIMGMIGCLKNPKFTNKDPFPPAVLALCKSSDELIESAKIVKHAETLHPLFRGDMN